ncbi:MAG: YcxB family protein [Chitinophagaceae bacterium]|nr:YcxB family protein [Chitinophagaceae bacterium]
MEYRFDGSNLVIKGESFKSELSWDKIPKVTQTKNWLLIWQGGQIANAIPKRDIPDGLPAELKAILAKNGVKNNL